MSTYKVTEDSLPVSLTHAASVYDDHL